MSHFVALHSGHGRVAWTTRSLLFCGCDIAVSRQTVIEALKFATTGLLPPNSAQGKTFVHDPKEHKP